MATYIVRRILQAFIILIGLSMLFFAILHVGPQGRYGQCQHYRDTPSPNSESLFQACVSARGLNQPLPVQYTRWVNTTVRLDFGQDYSGTPVIDTIKLRLPATLMLIGLSYIFQQLIALPLGLLGALKRYTVYDYVLTFFSYVGLSLPTFWLGIILIYILAIRFPVFPAGGINAVGPAFGTGPYWAYAGTHPWQTVGDIAGHLVLPALTLAIVGIGADSRFMRASMLDVINQDYVRTVRAKGLPRRTVILKHAVRNALLPIITNIGLFIPALISGAVITESVFGWPGMGQYFIQALGKSDNNTLQAFLLLTALFTLVGNLVADLLYAVADPRIRYS